MTQAGFLSRQSDMIDGELIAKINPLIVGAGSIGSNAAHILASMGVPKMTIIDDDSVDIPNIGPAFLADYHIGMSKVECLQEELGIMFGEAVTIVAIDERLTPATLLDDIYNVIIVGPDNMEARRTAWEMRHSICHDGEFAFIDGRMGGPQASVTCVMSYDEGSISSYEETLEQGDVPLACGLKATAPITKGAIPFFIGKIIYDLVNLNTPPYTQMVDLRQNVIFPINGSGQPVPPRFWFNR